jgi:hypothetical protein
VTVAVGVGSAHVGYDNSGKNLGSGHIGLDRTPREKREQIPDEQHGGGDVGMLRNLWVHASRPVETDPDPHRGPHQLVDEEKVRPVMCGPDGRIAETFCRVKSGWDLRRIQRNAGRCGS